MTLGPEPSSAPMRRVSPFPASLPAQGTALSPLAARHRACPAAELRRRRAPAFPALVERIRRCGGARRSNDKAHGVRRAPLPPTEGQGAPAGCYPAATPRTTGRASGRRVGLPAGTTSRPVPGVRPALRTGESGETCSSFFFSPPVRLGPEVSRGLHILFCHLDRSKRFFSSCKKPTNHSKKTQNNTIVTDKRLKSS